MSEINYRDLDRHLEGLPKNGPALVYLLYGEESLYKNALKALIAALLPENQHSTNFLEPIENNNIPQAIECVNTYAFLCGYKIVVLADARLDAPNILDELQVAVEKGFPENNLLIITTELADKRRKLYKTILKKGLIIDCSVPKGNRREDQNVRMGLLQEKINAILKPIKIEIDPDARQALLEMTGFDLRTLSNNLEKVISYIGERHTITRQDINAVLKRSKEEPLYALSGAIAERDASKALSTLSLLLQANYFSLQILAVIINQIRKIMVAKSFVLNSPGAWKAGMSYNHFQKQTLAAVRAHDKEISQQIKTKAKKVTSDLILIKGASPYPLYQLLLRSENFTMPELIKIIEALSAVDVKLKSSPPRTAQIIIESLILDICQGTL